MPISDELAQQALDKINELEQALANALAANKTLRADLRKARGGGTSAQERLAELQLRERGEHTEIGILDAAEKRGNIFRDARGENLITNMLDGDAVKRVRKDKNRRKR